MAKLCLASMVDNEVSIGLATWLCMVASHAQAAAQSKQVGVTED